MTDSDQKTGQTKASLTLKMVLSGEAQPPSNRAEQVARFELLKKSKGLKLARWAELCGISLATLKRWRKDGVTPERAATPLTDKRPGVDPHSDLTRPFDTKLEGFDAIHDLKRLSRTKDVPVGIRVSALRIIAAHENQRGRIPWESIKVTDIPEEVRHRLAGALLKLVSWDELPEEVRQASPARRRVYRLLGVLPADDQIAERALARYQVAAAELRAELVPEAVAVERPPLQVSLAVEAGRKAR